MASGRPVIAFRRGGATETVVESDTGVFFEAQTVESLSEAVTRFERMEFSPERFRAHSLHFGEERFLREMREKIDSYFAARGG
jgi:glycosyltransferase involved in cell wall biosynthesis